LDSSIPDTHIIPAGYTVFRHDRNRHGGCVLVLIRNSITVIHRKDLESDCEMLWLELHTSRGIINLVTYYRPPTATVDLLKLLHSALATNSNSLPVIVCGDFNVPDVDWSTTSPKLKFPVTDTLCQLVHDNFLSQLVSHPTRGENVLDLLLTTNPDLIASIEVTDSLPGCDHDAIHFMLSATIPQQSTTKRVLYNYKSANIDDFKEVLSRVSWDIIDFDNDDIELSWSQWKDLFFSAVNYVIPTVRWKRQKMKHWFSDSTIRLIHKKKRLYREYKRSGNSTTLKKYKAVSNQVRTNCRNETIAHSNLVCQQSHSNPKQFWRWINSLKGYRSPIPPLHDSCGNTITSDSDKATLFNDYFCSVFTKENISNLDSLIPKPSHSTIIDSIHVTPDEVHAELCQMNVNKACGPDNLTPYLLKNAADFIAVPLCHLFNKSLSTGTLPFDWVSGNIVPVHKRKDKHITRNYRPISLTSIVIKVFERIVHRQLVSSLERHNLLSSSQSGFRNKRSTVSLLTEAADDWSQCLEQRGTVHCLLLDFGHTSVYYLS